MINSVNIGNISNFSAKSTDTQSCKNSFSPTRNMSFGHEDEYKSHPIRDLFVTITDDFVGLVGFNAALWWLQDFVNGKLLVGKINKHFTNKIKDNDELEKLARQMLNENKLDRNDAKHVHLKLDGAPGQAFYTHVGNGSTIKPNSIVVEKNNYSSLFHEIGHAIEENKTNVFKWLQRGRGNYTILSLALYTLLSQNQKPQNYDDDDENQGIGGKIRNFLSKSNAVIPLLAFSPELITEGKASQTGLKFLKEKLGKGEITKELYKNIRRSYLTCFATYLFIPVSIMLMDSLQRSAEKVRTKKRNSINRYY